MTTDKFIDHLCIDSWIGIILLHSRGFGGRRLLRRAVEKIHPIKEPHVGIPSGRGIFDKVAKKIILRAKALIEYMEAPAGLLATSPTAGPRFSGEGLHVLRNGYNRAGDKLKTFHDDPKRPQKRSPVPCGNIPLVGRDSLRHLWKTFYPKRHASSV
jgi:hypothetical protein